MEREERTINAIAAKTWYWLRMNDVKVAWETKSQDAEVIVTADEGGLFKPLPLEEYNAVKEIKTGALEQNTVLFEELTEAKNQIVVPQEQTGQTVAFQVTAKEAGSAGAVLIKAQENTEVTVIETFLSEEESSLAYQTKILGEKNSHVHLYQVFLQNGRMLNDVGSELSEQATLTVTQIFLGNGDFYDGVRVELNGDASELHMAMAYLGQKQQDLDMNLIVNHWGKKTVSDITADGALNGAARKLFRGSIDFKKGSSQSVGAETEQVLLLSEDVVNKTIPLILCAEEDVQGTHGATIGELDEDTLYYFGARGIDAEEAKRIMTRGKLEMLYRTIPSEEIKERVAKRLTEVMEDDD